MYFKMLELCMKKTTNNFAIRVYNVFSVMSQINFCKPCPYLLTTYRDMQCFCPAPAAPNLSIQILKAQLDGGANYTTFLKLQEVKNKF